MNKAPRVLNKYIDEIPDDAVSIMRGGPYGNKYIIGRHGDRNEVCDLFEYKQLPSMNIGALRGKDLVCCCHPKRCHGHSIYKKLYGKEYPHDA